MKENTEFHNLPTHIAVIMDGNGRWAKNRGAARIFGHKNAIKAVREITEGCAEIGIKYLTLYAFSTENWNRPRKEVSGLMELLVFTLRNELKTLTNNNVRLKTIGDISLLPEACQNELLEVMDETRHNDGLTLILALNYSGRWELTEAVKKIAAKVCAGELDINAIDTNTVSEYLNESIPDPELLIRTSGEMRISNFLLWQIAYTELFFTSKLWPDFRKADLIEALNEYQKRDRRFGRISEQVKT
ncbi:MAG: isoprenyl transferase [Bacteroidetes bacterium]|nr:isoprenyl transferase [Bacteroidota bacterium]MCH8231849.1 isoprenyl transferase [Bacteroidota bacterium]